MDGSSTYEATRARQSTHGLPDKIHWSQENAFRSQPYRLLHHQNGLIGKFQVRLLEAADLQRTHWSALALGPVKHLGLSKAHGQISSFCSIGLTFEPALDINVTPILEGKPAATQRWKPLGVSPTVPQNNNPVWENCQFELALRKGAMQEDGMRVLLCIRMDEEATTAEQILPGIRSGGDSRLLGTGSLDVTSLCLGETWKGQSQVGVVDAWIPISLQDRQNEAQLSQDKLKQDVSKHPPKQANVTGRVRILVSYDPNGLDPQPHDLVALESFARRSPRHSTCRPLLPPLLPFYVLERRGPYILVEYELGRHNKKACMRLHRNAVFCVERKNLLDATINLALLPADLWMTTPMGRKTAEVVAPVVAAGRELFMPAMLSAKLVWIALRTTTLAGFSGVQAATGAMFHESAEALTGSSSRDRRPTYSAEAIANDRYVHL
jgi:hypothetical protein